MLLPVSILNDSTHDVPAQHGIMRLWCKSKSALPSPALCLVTAFASDNVMNTFSALPSWCTPFRPMQGPGVPQHDRAREAHIPAPGSDHEVSSRTSTQVICQISDSPSNMSGESTMSAAMASTKMRSGRVIPHICTGAANYLIHSLTCMGQFTMSAAMASTCVSACCSITPDESSIPTA